MRYLKALVPVLAVALVFASCAAKLPQADVDAATAAFTEAQTAQAEAFAADSYKAAAEANDALQANLTAKEYAKTRALAKALLDASTKAKADAAAGLEAAKAEIAALDTDIGALLPLVQKELALAVKAGKKAKVDVKNISGAVAAAPAAIEEAKANTDVAAGRAALVALKDNLAGFQKALEAAGYLAK